MFHGQSTIPERRGRTGKTWKKALNGTSTKKYMFTPSEFFTGGEVDTHSADTSGGDKYVLDKTGCYFIL